MNPGIAIIEGFGITAAGFGILWLLKSARMRIGRHNFTFIIVGIIASIVIFIAFK